jgi:hypothetical protein
MPILLKEDTLETIRTWSLERVHLIQRLGNFIPSYLLSKRLARLVVENRGLRKLICLALITQVLRAKKVLKVLLSFFPKSCVISTPNTIRKMEAMDFVLFSSNNSLV